MQPSSRRFWPMPILAGLALSGLAGCTSTPTTPAYAQRYRIEVALDPVNHQLSGRTVVDVLLAPAAATSKPVAVAFRLHPGLKITDLTAAGASVRGYRNTGPDRDAKAKPIPNRHVITLNEPADSFSLFVAYQGEVYQDASAGEKPGEIHNFEMTAHVGEDGIYLAGSYWYPEPVIGENESPPLADFTLLAQPIEGMDLVAGAVTDPRLNELTGMLAWRSPFPVSDMVMVGGAHDVHTIEHNGIRISAHLKPDQSQFAEGLLQATVRNLDRYEPLIGSYPANEYAIVDNFFSSGFAFPTFTLLSSAVINMGERSQTAHGYIDHEMLHSWWGNGIMVDPQDGNWCEALTSYATNYYGYVLDGDQDEARRKRRNYAHFLSRMEPEKDRPLGNYGREDSCSRGVAYSKGATVFHMLARKIGQNRFWAAMREFTEKFTGRYASWEDLRELLEAHGDVSLETFFTQWIRTAGAPTLELTEARYDSANQVLSLDMSQGDTDWELDVPIRIVHAAGSLDVDVHLDGQTQTVEIPIDVVPLSIELDPDYHVFRRIPLAQIFPTTAATRYGHKFTVVVPEGELSGDYAMVKQIFEGGFENDERMTLQAGEQNEGALAERCVLILGNAVRDPYVAAFLSAVEFPVTWDEDGFEVSGVRYDDPKDSVLCTAAHPGVPGGGITVVYANSEDAAPRGMNIPMYEHSLVIFEDGRPTVRLDFEKHQSVAVITTP